MGFLILQGQLREATLERDPAGEHLAFQVCDLHAGFVYTSLVPRGFTAVLTTGLLVAACGESVARAPGTGAGGGNSGGEAAGGSAGGGIGGGTGGSSVGGSAGVAVGGGAGADAGSSGGVGAAPGWTCSVDPARKLSDLPGSRELEPGVVATPSGVALVFGWQPSMGEPRLAHTLLSLTAPWPSGPLKAWFAAPPGNYSSGTKVGRGLGGRHAYLFRDPGSAPVPDGGPGTPAATFLVDQAVVGATTPQPVAVATQSTNPQFVTHTDSGAALYAFTTDGSKKARLVIGGTSYDDYACATDMVHVGAARIGPDQILLALVTGRPFGTCLDPNEIDGKSTRLQLANISGTSKPVLVQETVHPGGVSLRDVLGDGKGGYVIFAKPGLHASYKAWHVSASGVVSASVVAPPTYGYVAAMRGEELLVTRRASLSSYVIDRIDVNGQLVGQTTFDESQLGAPVPWHKRLSMVSVGSDVILTWDDLPSGAGGWGQNAYVARLRCSP